MVYPRTGSKGKIKIDRSMPEIYKKFLSMGYHRSKYSRGTVGKVCSSFNKMILNEMIYNAYEFRMPFQLGSLYIRAPKMKIVLDKHGKLIKKYMAINWFSTRQLWEQDEDAKKNKILVYHFNDHFDRRIAKFHYERRNGKYKNKSFYRFEKCRLWAEELAKAINNEEIDVNFVE